MGYDELLKLAQEQPNAQIQISLADLLECNRQIFEMFRAEMMAPMRTLHRENIISREEVSQLLGVDLSTLHRWNKKGILKAIRIGGKVYYDSSAVKEMMQTKGINN